MQKDLHYKIYKNISYIFVNIILTEIQQKLLSTPNFSSKHIMFLYNPLFSKLTNQSEKYPHIKSPLYVYINFQMFSQILFFNSNLMK